MLDLTEKEWYLEKFESRSKTLLELFRAMESVDGSNLSALRLAVGDVQTILNILYEDADYDASPTPDEPHCHFLHGSR